LTKLTLNPEKAIEIAKTVFSVHVTLNNGETVSKTIYTTQEQHKLADLFGL
jgi:hypothetical protein